MKIRRVTNDFVGSRAEATVVVAREDGERAHEFALGAVCATTSVESLIERAGQVVIGNIDAAVADARKKL